MAKVIQLVIYKEISDPQKLASYAALARPAMIASGARFLARGVPLAVKEAVSVVRVFGTNGGLN